MCSVLKDLADVCFLVARFLRLVQRSHFTFRLLGFVETFLRTHAHGGSFRLRRCQSRLTLVVSVLVQVVVGVLSNFVRLSIE